MRLIWGMVLTVLATAGYASDLLREQRIVNEIIDGIVVGEPVWLQAGKLRFLAIHAEAERADVRGGAIILHGRDANPTWVDVVQPLRVGLPAAGWETLSLQLPVAAADALGAASADLIPEAFPRIAAAIDFFRQRGIVNLVLIGHSLGARMAVEYVAAEKPPEVRALVAIGLSAGRDRDRGTLAALQQIRRPLLDIYGSRDIAGVLSSAPLRAAASRRAGNSAYRQLEMAGADHFFRGLDDTLISRVRSWMARVAPEEALPVKREDPSE